MSFVGSLEDSLWFLHKYVKDAIERHEKLDLILVPITQHVRMQLFLVIYFYFFSSFFLLFVYLFILLLVFEECKFEAWRTSYDNN
jgi:hypothetical protein